MENKKPDYLPTAKELISTGLAIEKSINEFKEGVININSVMNHFKRVNSPESLKKFLEKTEAQLPEGQNKQDHLNDTVKSLKKEFMSHMPETIKHVCSLNSLHSHIKRTGSHPNQLDSIDHFTKVDFDKFASLVSNMNRLNIDYKSYVSKLHSDLKLKDSIAKENTVIEVRKDSRKKEGRSI